MKSSSRGNSSTTTVVNTFVDKENTEPPSQVSYISNPKQRTKQKYNKEQQEEQKGEEQTTTATLEKPSDQMSLSSKIEFIEQKLLKLQSLKEDTVDELSNLLIELNDLVPVLSQLNLPNINSGEDEVSSFSTANESGLSKLLNRLQQLQQEYQKRRSVSENRYNYRIEAVKERHKAEIILNRNESISETAENYVSLIHKYKSKGKTSTSTSSPLSNLPTTSSDQKSDALKNGTSSSVIFARKRSLPAINQPVTICPPALKMARRQSVAAYPQISTNSRNMIVDSSILNLNLQNGLLTPKSIIDADLLAIKSRISKSLKR